MAPISQEQLHDVFAALKIKRKDLEGICGLSPHAPGRWRVSGRIPIAHLKRLGEALAIKLGNRKDLTAVEQRASKYIFLQMDD